MNQLNTNMRRSSEQVAILRDVTARNQLQFLQTEIHIGRTSARIASCHASQRSCSAAERQIATAKEAYRNANKFLARCTGINDDTRKRLRQDLMEIKRAIRDARSKIAALHQ